jgi:hypothetical protein
MSKQISTRPLFIALVLICIHVQLAFALRESELNAALSQTVISGDAGVIGILLGKGADPNAKNNDGETALMWAAVYKNADAVRLLPDKGADPNTRDNTGASALLWVTDLEFPEISKMLLAKGANVNLSDNNGYTALQVSAQKRLPIIDMHLHANSLMEFGGGGSVCTNDQKIVFPGVDPRKPITLDRVMTCASPMRSAASDKDVMMESLALLERYNIWAVTSGSLDRVSAWRAAAPHRIIPAVSFISFPIRPPEEFRRLFAEGKFAIFAEVGPQYRGLELGEETYDKYFSLAEELDIPVGVHLGEGPPGGPHIGGPTPSAYRARLTSPLQLEKVLIRHPKLRVYVNHRDRYQDHRRCAVPERGAEA